MARNALWRYGFSDAEVYGAPLPHLTYSTTISPFLPAKCDTVVWKKKIKLYILYSLPSVTSLYKQSEMSEAIKNHKRNIVWRKYFSPFLLVPCKTMKGDWYAITVCPLTFEFLSFILPVSPFPFVQNILLVFVTPGILSSLPLPPWLFYNRKGNWSFRFPSTVLVYILIPMPT